MFRFPRTTLFLVAFAFTACSAPNPSPDVRDTGTDATSDTSSDAPARCTVDTDCSDHTYCNGAERCMPSASNADARGCIAASPANPCAAGETCNEAAMRCDGTCSDSDGDGHRAASCGGDDCDDNHALRFPGNPERCDTLGHDDDCDPMTLGPDADHDMFQPIECCNTQPSGSLRCGGDCDDMRATVNPSAGESCNGLDDDCNGMVDDHGVLLTFYRDVDGDGYGNSMVTMSGCSAPLGYVLTMGDCNDAVPTIHPGAGDACGDMIDNDCNGAVDDGVHVDCYIDADRDGFAPMGATLVGVCGDSLGRCPSGYVATGATMPATTDCNDTQATVHPGAIENCNMIDDDCDGVVDDMAGIPQYRDADGDGHGAGAVTTACVVMTGYATNSDDCDDTNPSAHPGAPEACDGVDEDCDGLSDEGDDDTTPWCIGLPHVDAMNVHSGTGGGRSGYGHCISYSPSTAGAPRQWGCLIGNPGSEGHYECDTGWGDCGDYTSSSSGDGFVQGGDGCETDISSSLNCGRCGQRCTAPQRCCPMGFNGFGCGTC